MEKQSKPTEAQARSGLASSADFTRQQLKHLDREISLIYVSSLCDEDKIQKMIIVPFFECSNMDEYEQFIASLTRTEIPEKGTSYADDLLRGEHGVDRTCPRTAGPYYFLDGPPQLRTTVFEAFF